MGKRFTLNPVDKRIKIIVGHSPFSVPIHVTNALPYSVLHCRPYCRA